MERNEGGEGVRRMERNEGEEGGREAVLLWCRSIGDVKHSD
jgi:hypothetical protein